MWTRISTQINLSAWNVFDFCLSDDRKEHKSKFNFFERVTLCLCECICVYSFGVAGYLSITTYSLYKIYPMIWDFLYDQKFFGYYFHFVRLKLFVYCNAFRLVHYVDNKYRRRFCYHVDKRSQQKWVDLNLHCYLNGFICFFFGGFFSLSFVRFVKKRREKNNNQSWKYSVLFDWLWQLY